MGGLTKSELEASFGTADPLPTSTIEVFKSTPMQFQIPSGESLLVVVAGQKALFVEIPAGKTLSGILQINGQLA